MAETAYSKRMAELKQSTTDSNTRQMDGVFGLPRRPTMNQPTGPNINKPEAPDESYKDTDFYRNLQYHQQNDPHFNDMTNQYTDMVMGLKHQVEQGYMPMAIARQRVVDYIHDAANHRRSIDPIIQGQQNQQATDAAANTQLAMAINSVQQGQGDVVAQNQPQQPQGGIDG